MATTVLRYYTGLTPPPFCAHLAPSRMVQYRDSDRASTGPGVGFSLWEA